MCHTHMAKFDRIVCNLEHSSICHRLVVGFSQFALKINCDELLCWLNESAS